MTHRPQCLISCDCQVTTPVAGPPDAGADPRTSTPAAASGRHAAAGNATAVADGAVADGTVADGTAAAAAPLLAFPDNVNLHGGPGLLHLMKMGLLGAKQKIYFSGLIHHIAHAVLKRSRVTAAVKHYQACDNLDYRISDAIVSLMIDEWKTHPIYTSAASGLTSVLLLGQNYITWLKAGLSSRDAPFIYYASYVYGVGMLYRIARQGISMDDGLFLYALMLPSMGFFKLTSKHNLAYQCFLSLAKLLSSKEEVAKALLGNITASRSGRPFHNIGVDEMLEDEQGLTKFATGTRWSLDNAMVHTATGFFLKDIRNRFGTVTTGDEGPDKDAKGRHVQAAHADTCAIVDELRPMKLFAFNAQSPRDFSSLNVCRHALPPSPSPVILLV